MQESSILSEIFARKTCRYDLFYYFCTQINKNVKLYSYVLDT